jgi:transmembrane sensor
MDLQIWLAADASHRQEFEKLDRLWVDFDRVRDPRLAAQALPHASSSHGSFPSRRALVFGGLSAASLSGIMAVTGLPDSLTSDFYTSTGEQKSVRLEDGTEVELDADTAFSVHFTPELRRVALHRGQALFNVHAMKERPFEVAAADGRALALDTQFSVHVFSNEARVDVLKNDVTVIAPNRVELSLNAGWGVRYRQSGFDPAASVSSDTVTAWRRGKLIFEDQPLRDVVDDVNRFRRGKIVIMNQALLQLRVSGIFGVDDPDLVLKTLTQTLPVQAHTLTRYLVVLT